ncbi:unnamed protein product [Ectocarpus sp. 8 AP-2014]
MAHHLGLPPLDREVPYRRCSRQALLPPPPPLLHNNRWRSGAHSREHLHMEHQEDRRTLRAGYLGKRSRCRLSLEMRSFRWKRSERSLLPIRCDRRGRSPLPHGPCRAGPRCLSCKGRPAFQIWLRDKARCFGNLEQELTFWVAAAT